MFSSALLSSSRKLCEDALAHLLWDQASDASNNGLIWSGVKPEALLQIPGVHLMLLHVFRHQIGDGAASGASSGW